MSAARVAVLAGGLSLERETSLRSGRRVAGALEQIGHDVTRIDADDDLVTRLLDGDVDVAYLALHGAAGEDGTIQSLLELVGTPYTGPDSVASSLAWDKGVAKGLFARAGIDTPDWSVVSATGIRDLGAGRVMGRLVERIGLPVVVKPTQAGGSMGMSPVVAADELGGALMGALSYHDVALVERLIEGTEVAVSIVGDEVIGTVEIVPADGDYDFAARYTAGATSFYAPARLDDATLAACADVALAAYRAVGARHVSRADLIVDRDGRPWLLELDTCPGMTDTSLLPIAAGGAGLPFIDLCDRILQLALASSHAPIPS